MFHSRCAESISGRVGFSFDGDIRKKERKKEEWWREGGREGLLVWCPVCLLSSAHRITNKHKLNRIRPFFLLNLFLFVVLEQQSEFFTDSAITTTTTSSRDLSLSLSPSTCSSPTTHSSKEEVGRPKSEAKGKGGSDEMIEECSVCHSKFSPNKTVPLVVSRAYDRHRNDVSSKTRALNILLVLGDCFFVGLQPILVYMSKVDGQFKFSPISVNFLTEVAKILFALLMLFIQARHSTKVGDKPLLSFSTFVQAARNNVLLAVPALLYAVNNYLKFIMQLYFNPATVKMLSNLKVLVIAVLLKMIMKRRFSIIQWEALALLLIGITVNQLKSLPEGTTALGLPVVTGAYLYTLIFVTVPSLASVFNEYALKSQFETSIYLQNLFLYGYGAIFNFLAILITAASKGRSSFDILQGHSKATMLLICNNAAQGILSSFFFKYADTILKKYSSTVATIFTAIASAALFGHTLTINFILGISIVFISMHQFFSPMSKVKDETQNSNLEMVDGQNNQRSKGASLINMAAGANEDASHHVERDEKAPLLPI